MQRKSISSCDLYPRTKRTTAGIHSRLDNDYEWPASFGLPKKVTKTVNVTNENHQKGKDELDNIMPNHQVEASEINEESDILCCQTINTDNRDPSNDKKSETLKSNQSKKTMSNISCPTTSRTAKSTIERKKRALEIEKAKLKILELENEIHESETASSRGQKSLHSSIINPSKYDDNMTVAKSESSDDPLDRTEKWVNELTSDTFDCNEIMGRNTEIKMLCNTISEAIKSVGGTASRQNTFSARQIVERDFPYFDGNPEEWPTFISQFTRISSLCQYSSEEQLIKLSKCLKGDAKFAVSGMMMSPKNIDLVLKTLERRFGRPDQIIERLIAKVHAISPIKEHHMDSIIQFSNHIRCLVATIKSLECEDHLKNPQVLKDAVQKLPDMLRLRWGEEVAKYNGNSDIEKFSNWIDGLAMAACYVTPMKTSVKPETRTDFRSKPTIQYYTKKHETSLIASEIKTKTEHCIYCTYCKSNDHAIRSCSKFIDEDVENRWKFATDNKLCFSCLKKNHQTSKCKGRHSCGVNDCKRPHHRLLHKEERQPRQEDISAIPSLAQDSMQNDQTINQNVLAVGHGSSNVLLRIVKVKLYANNSFLETTALCDEGSSVTLIDKSITDELGLQGRKEPLCVQWTNNLSTSHQNSSCVNIDISGVFQGAKLFNMRNIRTIENLSLPLQVIERCDWEKYSHLRNLPLQEIRERPMILLGQDQIRLTVARKIVTSGRDYEPIATKTNLGWIMHGASSDDQSIVDQSFSFHICSNEVSNEALHQLVKQSFTTDAFGVQPFNSKSRASKDEERAMQIMETTAKRVKDRFEIGLFWKSDEIVLPESKPMAMKRLYCVEKQMLKDENFKNHYCQKIQSYLDKGYAKKLSDAEANMEGPRCWYLPHFGVINPKKPKKFRLVFDAAARSNGTSLNDNLLPGPDLLQSLVEILIKFRQRKIASCADVREMFHQVVIRPEDRNSQRFLWREGNTDAPFEVYEMQVMIFGATCSPASAQFIKNLNADQQTTIPDILEAIKKKHYVDDYLDCSDTVEEALFKISEVRRIQKLAGFELVSWTSNSELVMNSLPDNDPVVNKEINQNCDFNIQRVLGISWNPKTDEFCYQLQLVNTDEDEYNRPTKRKILKCVMSIFEPLGLITNITIRAKILIQEIWKSGIGWDDVIDEELGLQWKSWLVDIKRLDELTIPRCYSSNLAVGERVELHIFCDASKKAFAAASYLRVLSRDNIDVSLIFAKARVAPTKPISIPRLELQAALMGSRIMNTITNILEIHIDKIYMWSDSMTVLYWIKGDGGKLGQFESHRIGEIQEITNTSDWHWIPSKLNAADQATRTGSKERNYDFGQWYNGPDFLYLRDESFWPIRNPNTEVFESTSTVLSSDIITIIIEYDSCLSDISRFSKWLKLIRATAWVLKFCKNLLTKIRDKNVSQQQLTPTDIQEAEWRWIRQCQREIFQEEINALKNKSPLKSQSRLRNLSPVLNDEEIIVLGGRTDLAEHLEMTTRRPIILPPRHPYTRLLLHHYHRKFAHQGMETVLNEVRQIYWIIDGRSAVRSVFAECRRCGILKSKPNVPEMGQLPNIRLTPTGRAFTYTGVDYFGPLYVTVGRRQEKRWGVLFTCLSVRAVHLEVAHSLTTDSAIMAVRRMAARRGQPKAIYSDNGTNFRGASEELKRAIQELDQQKMNQKLLDNGTEWKFLPTSSPHMAGVWERLVRSVKNTFNIILNKQILKEELLLTLFSECENIINSRPITKVSTDSNDLESLTPNHFLLGGTNIMTPYEELDAENLRSNWRKSQALKNCFWKRWTKEYLPTLTRRTKWNRDGKPININDIVIIVEDNYPRKFWKLGRVETVFPGPDGKIRVVQVKTANGLFKRPVSKLCRVDVEVCERR